MSKLERAAHTVIEYLRYDAQTARDRAAQSTNEIDRLQHEVRADHYTRLADMLAAALPPDQPPC